VLGRSHALSGAVAGIALGSLVLHEPAGSLAMLDGKPLPARMPQSRATDGPNCTACPGDSVHEPVHSKAPISFQPATVRNVARSAQPTAARANSQTPPRGVARFILLLDVRGGGLDDC
jgi:hypothetical protein